MKDYRGQRIDIGEWAYGWLIEYKKFCFIFDSTKGGYIIFADNVAFNLVEVIPESIGEYLRKDKNGDKIYSNMPIRYRDKEYPKGFVWDESGLRWTLDDGYFHTHYGTTGTGGEDDHLDLEIIKDEHPNLLEKK